MLPSKQILRYVSYINTSQSQSPDELCKSLRKVACIPYMACEIRICGNLAALPRATIKPDGCNTLLASNNRAMAVDAYFRMNNCVLAQAIRTLKDRKQEDLRTSQKALHFTTFCSRLIINVLREQHSQVAIRSKRSKLGNSNWRLSEQRSTRPLILISSSQWYLGTRALAADKVAERRLCIPTAHPPAPGMQHEQPHVEPELHRTCTASGYRPRARSTSPWLACEEGSCGCRRVHSAMSSSARSC